jgi:hypothetical protein
MAGVGMTAGEFSLLYNVQTNSGARPVSYTVGKEGTIYLGFKRREREANLLVLKSIMVDLYFLSPI